MKGCSVIAGRQIYSAAQDGISLFFVLFFFIFPVFILFISFAGGRSPTLSSGIIGREPGFGGAQTKYYIVSGTFSLKISVSLHSQPNAMGVG